MRVVMGVSQKHGSDQNSNSNNSRAEQQQGEKQQQEQQECTNDLIGSFQLCFCSKKTSSRADIALWVLCTQTRNMSTTSAPSHVYFLIAVFFVTIFGLGGSHQNSQGDLNSWCPSGVQPSSDLIIEGGEREHWFPLSSCAQYFPGISKAEMCLLDLRILSTFLVMLLHFI